MIIYWIGEDKVFVYVNVDGTIRLFERLEEAEYFAKNFQESENRFKTIKIEARVISIERVSR